MKHKEASRVVSLARGGPSVNLTDFHRSKRLHKLTHSSYQQENTSLSSWDIYNHDIHNLQQWTVLPCDCKRKLEALRWLQNNTGLL